MKQTMKIIPETGAILIEDDKKILVVSDLHLDDDNDDVKVIIKELKKLISKYSPKILLVTGDMFNFGNGAGSIDFLEKELSKLVKIQVVVGNHDLVIYPFFLVSDNYCFCHGDQDFGIEDKFLIMGHTHPFLNNKRVFLQGELKDGRKFMILPTFNTNLGGQDVKKEKNSLFGFVFENKLIKNCDILNLAGEKIGEL